MINPLTFDVSDPKNENLTWSRDIASVTDAILSAKTSSEIFSKQTVQAQALGSSPLYISSFSATVAPLNSFSLSVNIQQLTAYLGGRYFEINDETTTIYAEISDGLGEISLSVTDWRNDGGPLVFLKGALSGQAGTGRALNSAPRDPEQRKHMHGQMTESLLICWNQYATSTTQAYAIGPNSLFARTGQTSPIDPQHIEPKALVFHVGEREVVVPTTYARIGDRRLGVLGFVSGSNSGGNLEGVISKIKSTPSPAHPIMKGYSDLIITNKPSDSDLIRSNLAGINCIGNSQTNPKIDLAEFNTYANHDKYDLWLPDGYAEKALIYEPKGTGVTVWPHGFDSVRFKGLQQYSKAENIGAYPIFTNDEETDVRYSYDMNTQPQLIADTSVNVSSIEYKTERELLDDEPEALFITSGPSYTPNIDIIQYAVVRVEASALFKVDVLAKGSTVEAREFPTNGKITFIAYLPKIQTFRTNEAGETFTSSKDYFDKVDDFKKDLSEAGISDFEFFERFTQPHALAWLFAEFQASQYKTLNGWLCDIITDNEKQNTKHFLQVFNVPRGVHQNFDILQ